MMRKNYNKTSGKDIHEDNNCKEIVGSDGAINTKEEGGNFYVDDEYTHDEVEPDVDLIEDGDFHFDILNKNLKTNDNDGLAPDTLGVYISGLPKADLLTFNEEKELFLELAKHEKNSKEYIRIRNIIVNHNLRLVIFIAKRYRQYSTPAMEFIDIIQEGNIGLFTAIERFDINKGFKFSTYATHWIRSEIQRALAAKSQHFKSSVHIFHVQKKLLAIRARLYASLHRKPTFKEIAKEAGCSEGVVENCFKSMHMVISGKSISYLSKKSNLNSDESLQISEADVFEDIENQIEMENLLDAAKAILNERAFEIFVRRNEIGGHEKTSLATLSVEMGISQEYVRQIEKKSLKVVSYFMNTGQLPMVKPKSSDNKKEKKQ